MSENLDAKIASFEQTLQKLATQIATGALLEKIPPDELLEKTEEDVNKLSELAEEMKEELLMLKPEKAYSVERCCRNVTQTLTTFRDILLQKSVDPLANSRLALDQLRKALTDGSDYLVLIKELRGNPSPLIEAILKMRMTCEGKGQVLTIKVPEEAKTFFEHFYKHIQALAASLNVMEKTLADMKHHLNELHRQVLRMGSREEEEEGRGKNGGKASEKAEKQLSLQNFRGKGG